MADWYAGIDVGGTNVRAAAVTTTGEVLHADLEPLDVAEGGPAFAQLGRLVGRLGARAGGGPRAVGIGATGPLDLDAGTIANPWTLPPSWQGDVRGAVRAQTGVPVVLENDADAAALAEAWIGSGRGARALVCVTVGTGIGVGVVAGDRLHRGARGVHPEGGHLVVDPAGPDCYCGGRGCLESLASGTAVVTRARERGAAVATAKDVVDAARAGDVACRAVLADAHAALLTGVRTLVAVHAPDHVVLAGGAIADPGRLAADARDALAAVTFAPPGGTRVTLAALGPQTGAIGAARRAMTA